MAWLSHADQNQFSVPRQYSRRADCPGFSIVPRPRPAMRNARYSGMAEFLLQKSDVRRRLVSGARSVYSIDETQEHAAVSKRRGSDYPLGNGVLRLRKFTRNSLIARETSSSMFFS